MLNQYLIVDLIHHQENKKLLAMLDKSEGVFKESISLFSSLVEKDMITVSPILCRVNLIDININRELENKKNSIIFIVSSMSLRQLAAKLHQFMDIKLSDGRTGIMRMYDPRVFKSFNKILTVDQSKEFWLEINSIKGWDELRNNYFIIEGLKNA